MKRQILAFTVILTGCVAYGQEGVSNQGTHPAPGPAQQASNSADARFPVMAYFMTFPSPMKGADQVLGRMGDDAAAQVLAIVGARPPLSPAQMQTALDIIHKAFAKPGTTPPEKRKPTSALKLLQVFQATATDQLVKERIAAETNFLNAVPQVVPPITLSGDVPFGPNPFPPK